MLAEVCSYFTLNPSITNARDANVCMIKKREVIEALAQGQISRYLILQSLCSCVYCLNDA